MASGLKSQLFASSIFEIISDQYDYQSDKDVSDLPYEFNVSNKIIKDKVVLNYAASKNLTFEDCTFEGEFLFEATEFTTMITFIKCLFTKEILFSEGKFTKKISFVDCTVPHMYLSKGVYYHIECLGSFHEIKVGNIEIETLKIHRTVEYFSYEATTFKGSIDLHNARFLNFTGALQKDSKIRLMSIYCRVLCIMAFINEGTFKILGLWCSFEEDYGGVILIDVDLGNAQFNHLDLRSFPHISIINCLFTDVSFVNVIWPKNLFPNDTSYSHQKDVYRQIKNSLSKQGDFISAHKFHILEMNTYNKQLKMFSDEIFNKIILTASNVTSGYGQNLFKPIATLIMVNGILFWLLFRMNSSRYELDNLIYTLAEFIKICNPLHKNDPEFSGLSFIIDTLIRIVSSYCIYNFIRASRKFIARREQQ